MDEMAFTGMLVDHGQHLETASSHRSVMHEVPSPDMPSVSGFRRQSRAGACPPSLGLARRHPKPHFTPETLDESSADIPALLLE